MEEVLSQGTPLHNRVALDRMSVLMAIATQRIKAKALLMGVSRFVDIIVVMEPTFVLIVVAASFRSLQTGSL